MADKSIAAFAKKVAQALKEEKEAPKREARTVESAVRPRTLEVDRTTPVYNSEADLRGYRVAEGPRTAPNKAGETMSGDRARNKPQPDRPAASSTYSGNGYARAERPAESIQEREERHRQKGEALAREKAEAEGTVSLKDRAVAALKKGMKNVREPGPIEREYSPSRAPQRPSELVPGWRPQDQDAARRVGKDIAERIKPHLSDETIQKGNKVIRAIGDMNPRVKEANLKEDERRKGVDIPDIDLYEDEEPTEGKVAHALKKASLNKKR